MYFDRTIEAFIPLACFNAFAKSAILLARDVPVAVWGSLMSKFRDNLTGGKLLQRYDKQV